MYVRSLTNGALGIPLSQAMKIEEATLGKLEEILNVFRLSVARSCSKDYSPEQIAAWLNSAENKERWSKAIDEQYFLLALVNDQIVGFGSLKNGDYLDFLYIHPDFQGQGIASALLNTLLDRASGLRKNRVSSHVSITAKPFFQTNGFVVMNKNQNIRGSEVLINYTMELNLETSQ